MEVELFEGLNKIGQCAFHSCISLKQMAIPSSLRVIDSRVFKLVEVELYEGLKEIGYWAFHGCKSLKQITIPSSFGEIGLRAFEGCVGLIAVLCKRLHIDFVEGWASLPHEGLVDVGLSFGDYAFKDCKSLRNIAIPPTCQVGRRVFDETDALKKHFHLETALLYQKL